MFFPTTGQPCATFGLHPSLEKMQTLYQAGDAAFYANVGSLVEPLTVEDWKAGIKRVPRSVGACVAASLVPRLSTQNASDARRRKTPRSPRRHNQQQKAAQNLDADRLTGNCETGPR